VKAAKKYAIINRFAGKYPITRMCRFFSVSRSGYYKWRTADKSVDIDKPIGELIRKCQEKTSRTYGYRRVKQWLLRKTGLIINHKAVLRIMNKYSLLAEIRRPRPLYIRQNQFKKYDNMLKRNFIASKPNQKWVTDISYIRTKEGTLYLSMIKDLYDNFIVAYDTATIQDNALVYRTIMKAKEEVADGQTLHSDQGFQYTSYGYFNLTKDYGILPSMSRAGTPLDNAPAESFFGTLKSECISRQKIKSFEHAKELIEEYIHFYNYERIQLKTKLTPYEKRCQLE
jgi:transposase InsO family protein